MAPRTRLVRRAPLLTRLQAYLNPLDFLLWLSEEINAGEWQELQQEWATPIGIVLNVVFMVARANSKTGQSDWGSEVFGDTDERWGSGWLAWLASLLYTSLSILSLANAIYTFTRKRHYRLFESSINAVPNTPSARRVRVDSSPAAASPLHIFSDLRSFTSAASRAHPDPSRDVWELQVWDPPPLCLWLFCLFSPGHVLIYWLFLPLHSLDPRPSVTVVTTIFLATLLSVQLTLLKTFFTQQAKDNTVIHKEVQNEYDTKFVRPMVHREVRDAATQSPSKGVVPSRDEVLTYTPTTYVNRGFQTNPNPNYSNAYDPDHQQTTEDIQQQRVMRASSSPSLRTPAANTGVPLSSPLQPGLRQPQFRASSAGDGGHLGVHSHAQSPLKKAAALNSAAKPRASDGFVKREGTPLKRMSMPSGVVSPRPDTSQGRSDQSRGDGVRSRKQFL